MSSPSFSAVLPVFLASIIRSTAQNRLTAVGLDAFISSAAFSRSSPGEDLEKAAEEIKASRPTAVNLF